MDGWRGEWRAEGTLGGMLDAERGWVGLGRWILGVVVLVDDGRQLEDKGVGGGWVEGKGYSGCRLMSRQGGW